MSIMNMILIVAVIGIAILVIYYYINAKKKAEVVDVIDVDDQTYTLSKMIEFVKRRLDEITKINLYDIGLSEEELKLVPEILYRYLFIAGEAKIMPNSETLQQRVKTVYNL